MFNQSGIITTALTNPASILFNAQSFVSTSILVSSAAAFVTIDGRKIVKAGTPLKGNLQARTSAFVNATDASGTWTVSGILLNDVDVTTGNANGSLLLWGFVNLDNVDTSQASPAATLIASLTGRITYLKNT